MKHIMKVNWGLVEGSCFEGQSYCWNLKCDWSRSKIFFDSCWSKSSDWFASFLWLYRVPDESNI